MKIYMKNPTGINWSSCAYHIRLSLLEAARLKVTVLIKAIIRIIYNRLINPAGLLGVAGHYHPVLHVTCHSQSLVDYSINMPESSKYWNWTQYRCQRREEKEMDHTYLVMTVSDYHKHWYWGSDTGWHWYSRDATLYHYHSISALLRLIVQ